jgi:TRAP-type mannitol/chloroaromatic compound transport system substrate-binding protein
MKRRELLVGAGAGALTACAPSPECTETGATQETISWKMVTTWPPNFPALGTGVLKFADDIAKASGGRLQIKVYAAGELIPAFETFDAVSQGTADLGHGAAYYWKGKVPSSQFFTALPFGMTATEMNGWMYFGGGLELYREVYAPFGLLPFPAGNSGVQMGGWFNKEINSIADLQGLKMRIPGLGGDVLQRAGGTPVTMPGSEIFTALQTGSIDATEWIGPYNDMAFGLHKAASHYYYPGWQEPGPLLECIVNKDAFAALPEDLQTIVELACSAMNDQMTAEFMARNAMSLAQLEAEGKTNIKPFPDEVLKELKRYSDEAVADLVASDKTAARVYESYKNYRDKVVRWSAISEKAILNTRDL